MNTIHCPIKGPIAVPSCDAAEIVPLLNHLRANLGVTQDTVFPRGTVTRDGRLDLCKQSLGPQACGEVTRALEQNSQVVSLLLGTDSIGDVGAADVAHLVEKNQNLEIVYLGCNGIKEPGAERIAMALAQNKSVTGLWFKRNPIGDGGVKSIAVMLAKNQTLRVLDLVNTGMTFEGLRTLTAVLRTENRTLERLYLGGNGLGPEAGTVLADLLRDNSSLNTLMLSVNELGDMGLESLLEGLKNNRTLEELSLASNGLTSIGACLLARALHCHPTLTRLDISWSPSTKVLGATPNQIGDAGAAHFAELLRTNCVLQSLNLQRNGISPVGVEQIETALASNNTLNQLLLDGRLSPSIRAQLEVNRSAGQSGGLPRDVALIRSVYRTQVA